jgi:hypothetical protein
MKKKIFFTIAVFLFILGCKNENGNEEKFYIDVTVANGEEYTSQINEVYAGIINDFDDFNEIDIFDIEDKCKIISKTNYDNGTFTIGLPEKLDKKNLISLEKLLKTDNNIQISDKTAMIVPLIIIAKVNNTSKGAICKSNYDPKQMYLWIVEERFNDLIDLYASGISATTYIYSDKHVTIKGELLFDEVEDGVVVNPYTFIYNLTFKPGWNIYNYISVTKYNDNYVIIDSKMEITNEEPTGMKWYFIDNNDFNIELE